MSIGDYFSSSAQQRTFGQLQDAESEKITMDNRSFREPAKVAGRNALGGLFGNSGRQLRRAFHECAYIARIAWFDDIVKSATRNFNTPLP